MLSILPADAQKFALVLLLSFLVGLEHEEHKGEREGRSPQAATSFIAL